ncbi:hypothetical protein ZIOFF_035137 [Zingiber officinale]|uniref:Retrovirus-related Pol polyprotein from transposon TNT 1-94 n=1 Tax=Zingiber officinale TaxID=94328 RepID=A0A8J5G8Y0_ZINOF|nr:hypothetical protein ZIOFF_035137 [Zingiber officinale]
MRAILAHRDLDDALLGIDNMPSSWAAEEKSCKDRKALSQIHLHLSNQILQNYLKAMSTTTLWRKLEQLCMTKSLTNKLHLKRCLYSHQMSEVKYDEEDLALILLCSLPTSYAIFRGTILYTRDSLTLDELYDALLSKEKMDKLVGGSEAKSESLVARGRPHERSSGGDSWSRPKFEKKGKQLEKSGVADVTEDYSVGELIVAFDGDPRSSEE